MKTPMQELIDRLEHLVGLAEGTLYEAGLKSAKSQAESMLEKEKGVMCEIYDDAIARFDPKYFGGEGEDYYNQTFEPIER